MSNKETQELKNLMEKYPKMALQGKKLELDHDWKKGFTALMAVNLINAKFTRQLGVLGEQIDDGFNSAFDKGTQVPLNEEATNNLKIMFRLKNSFNASANYLTNTMEGIDKLILPGKNLMDEGLFDYYVSCKGILLNSAAEQRRLMTAIDKSSQTCFAKEIKQLPVIEAQALEGLHTAEDIKIILKRVEESMNIKLV